MNGPVFIVVIPDFHSMTFFCENKTVSDFVSILSWKHRLKYGGFTVMNPVGFPKEPFSKQFIKELGVS